MVAVVTASGAADPPSRELLEAAEKRGGGEFVDPLSLSLDMRTGVQLLAGGLPASRYDAFILRGFNRSGDVDMQFETFELLELAGFPVLNPSRALSVAESKSVTLYLLRQAGIPTPRTVICQTMDVAREAVAGFGQAVAKPLFGALGIGVERVEWPAGEERLEAMLAEWRALCIQEFVPTGGRDIRVFVVGGQILGAVLRIAQGEEWRTNVHQGGACEPYVPTACEREMCLRASSLIGLEYTGIDILPGPGGPLLLEVNGAPQWHGLAAATGLDVAGAVVGRALELARQRPMRAAA